jgi:hypothetical protein
MGGPVLWCSDAMWVVGKTLIQTGAYRNDRFDRTAPIADIAPNLLTHGALRVREQRHENLTQTCL